MRKALIAAMILVGVFLALASGCAMVAREPDPTMAAATTTQPTQAPTDAPTEPTDAPTTPTDPTEAPTIPTEPPATEPPATQPTEPELPELKRTVCIDAGHQRYGVFDKEPNGPGSDVMKAKLTAGTRGGIHGDYGVSAEFGCVAAFGTGAAEAGL